jgi:hypothetical protein
MDPDVYKILKEHTLERDRIELSTGDVLDVKAGLLLVMLVFLAEQTSNIFQANLNTFQALLEWVSILGLIIGGLLAVVQLTPKKYSVLSYPGAYEKWLRGLRNLFSEEVNPDAEVMRVVEDAEISQAVERIDRNLALNRNKVRLIKLCFYCVMTTFLANIVMLASTHLSPLRH